MISTTTNNHTTTTTVSLHRLPANLSVLPRNSRTEEEDRRRGGDPVPLQSPFPEYEYDDYDDDNHTIDCNPAPGTAPAASSCTSPSFTSHRFALRRSHDPFHSATPTPPGYTCACLGTLPCPCLPIIQIRCAPWHPLACRLSVAIPLLVLRLCAGAQGPAEVHTKQASPVKQPRQYKSICPSLSPSPPRLPSPQRHTLTPRHMSGTT